ncbi:MAG: nucleotidyltransferase domain-containing protein [Coriobacteriia bacterium]|nr:nucleotidyltransferase domain-containing protein [Coriobacteriia bacterium]
MWLYTLEQNPLAQHFRVLENLIMLSGLVRRIAEISARVILYGSAAQGTDTSESDIDLFVITEEPDKVAAEIRCFPSDRLIMPVIQTSAEYAVSRIKDGAFIDEVKRGVVLFEKAIDEQRL